jgi:L-fucose mutarotase/ribose pyranase (RbsD/FucU family)
MKPNWEQILGDRLQLFGHRNWLVIADSAYPAQTRQGVETIVADEEQTTVLAGAIAALGGCQHIKPTIYIDKELRSVSEEDARGITAYRKQLERLFDGHEMRPLPHEEIISKLDRVGEMFRVLLIKSNMRIPYTSVFFELKCGYWNTEAENRLRAAMRSTNQRGNAAKRKRR